MDLFPGLTVPLVFLILPCLSQKESSCDALERTCFRVAALIPARAGSKGIRNKNLAIIGNETLLSRSLRIINDFGRFDSVWVLTDGEAIAEEAMKKKSKVHWRDPQTATDNASTVSAIEDFLSKKKDYEIVAVVQCTSPFLQKNFLQEALDIMLTADVDCVFSVTRTFELRWIEKKDSTVFPVNFNPKKRPRRQDWNGELVENGMFYFAKSRMVTQDKILQNKRCRTVQIPKEYSLEIDTETDLLLARYLLPLLDNSYKI